ncbi:MAG: DUF4347 domain-containing protein, partial [Cyanobacteria bacterium P01_H01_bin.121]
MKSPQLKRDWSGIFYVTGVITLGVVLLRFNAPVFAQSITAAADGTGTIVTLDGNQFKIEGGSLSGDGANLFHSFENLGLSSQQIVTFMSQPDIRNILGRVVGGSPSVIDGLLHVTGGNANLFLMNPAGLIFGPNASLNVPGDFTATTADGIGFEGGWFNSIGPNQYQMLTGFPNRFSFLNAQPGAIINAGHLSVSSGANLSFSGGTVINTGTLGAPGGNVTLTAIPGENMVRISQQGRILGLEVPEQALAGGITPTDLPTLLTNAALSQTELVVRPDGTAVIREVAIQPGDVLVGGAISGEAVNLNAANQVTSLASETPRVLTGDGTYSAPTVRLFPQSEVDDNAYVFIDATVADYETFLYGGEPGTTSVVVTPEEDGIAKITNTLQGVTDVDALHILSEGNQGNFWLGETFISHDNVEQYRADFESWGHSLTTSADLFIYACFVALGLEGEALAQAMSDFTGADVAASTNLTGSSAIGGDWALETNIGTIESNLAFRQQSLDAYRHALALITVTIGADNTDPDGQVTLREAIVAANNDSNMLVPDVMATGVFGNDQIRFSGDLTINLDFFLGALEINDSAGNLLIDGQTNQVIVSGGGNVGVFEISNGGGNASVTLKDLTIQNGSTGGNGGGIFNNGSSASLTLENTTVTGSTASGRGGGIFSGSGDVNL